MKANQLVQKLVTKLLGKKATRPASNLSAGMAGEIKPDTKAQHIPLKVHIGNWQLHEHWRN